MDARLREVATRRAPRLQEPVAGGARALRHWFQRIVSRLPSGRIPNWTFPFRSGVTGRFSVPLLDDVQAEGLTAEELKEVLTQELSEYVAAPDVTVIVVEMNSRDGERDGWSGVFRNDSRCRSQTRVLDAISMMGGFSPYARKNDIRILRQTDDGIVEYHFHYDDYVSGKAPDSNLILKPGDHVVVPD